jgi:hypothetical protein
MGDELLSVVVLMNGRRDAAPREWVGFRGAESIRNSRRAHRREFLKGTR